jgi:thioredoxin-like negative regulator of GroEL
VLSVLALAAGCATPVGQGEMALRQGRYAEAARYFGQALDDQPDRTDALRGFGIARYKQRELDGAIATLQRVVSQAPGDVEARLYLALSHVQRGDAGPAQEQLTALRNAGLEPRLATQIERALEVLGAGPLTDPVRSFVASSLEYQAELVRELIEARRQVEWAQRAVVPPPCVLVRRNGVFYCL